VLGDSNSGPDESGRATCRLGHRFRRDAWRDHPLLDLCPSMTSWWPSGSGH